MENKSSLKRERETAVNEKLENEKNEEVEEKDLTKVEESSLPKAFTTTKKNHQSQKKQKQKIFPYGNYSGYYGYRTPDFSPDARLCLLKEDWLFKKRCLDIGCNSGQLTIEIARNFKCKTILGVDIDGKLIQKAEEHLKWQKNRLEALKDQNRKIAEMQALQSCSFQQENYIGNLEIPKELFDTIICLSVTKWIHLNWGDQGILNLFSKVFSSLTPGGCFIVEPQPWNSYKKKYNLRQEWKDNYHNIKLRPNAFPQILKDEIGFSKVENLHNETIQKTEVSKGFSRPIFFCIK